MAELGPAVAGLALGLVAFQAYTHKSPSLAPTKLVLHYTRRAQAQHLRTSIAGAGANVLAPKFKKDTVKSIKVHVYKLLHCHLLNCNRAQLFFNIIFGFWSTWDVGTF